MEKIKKDEIYTLLNETGLEDEEIISIEARNRYLSISSGEEVSEMLNYLYRQCKLSQSDVKKLIVNNPFLLNESMSRVTILEEIYKSIGFTEKEYRKFLNGFDKALSLNPKELVENIEKLRNSGKSKKEIKRIMLEKPYKFF